MNVLGLDIGSLFSKAVILTDDEFTCGIIRETTGDFSEKIDSLIYEACEKAGIRRTDLGAVVGTGRGADLIRGADFIEDEVNCVGAATAFLFEEADMAVHIGGQSITSLLLDEQGEVVNFMRNDKCASGSGKFLEVISRKLQFPVEQIDEIADVATSPVAISNQCAVFAESEVISHVNDGASRPDIVAGICVALANMVVSQGRRFGENRLYTITGGVARFHTVTDVVCKKLGGTYLPFPYDPRFAAAIGAALLGGTD